MSAGPVVYLNLLWLQPGPPGIIADPCSNLVPCGCSRGPYGSPGAFGRNPAPYDNFGRFVAGGGPLLRAGKAPCGCRRAPAMLMGPLPFGCTRAPGMLVDPLWATLNLCARNRAPHNVPRPTVTDQPDQGSAKFWA